MQTRILHIFTRTPLHVGAGSSVGAIDQPVIRERHTGFPVIPGSALKGVLADLWADELVRKETQKDGKTAVSFVRPDTANSELCQLFGNEDASAAKAGALLLGEAKLLAFPVRSAKGCFAWLTCPLALARYARDADIALPVLSVSGEQLRVTDNSALKLNGEKVILEEYPFTVASDAIPPAITDALKPAVTDAVWQNLPAHLAVISDELFAYFAVNACEVAQHVRIDDEKGTVAKGALFNQENVPSETLFYAPVRASTADALDKLAVKLTSTRNLLQLGGDATTGLGWCSLNLTNLQ
jgi:CRISPR-associated protein Cmr4